MIKKILVLVALVGVANSASAATTTISSSGPQILVNILDQLSADGVGTVTLLTNNGVALLEQLGSTTFAFGGVPAFTGTLTTTSGGGVATLPGLLFMAQ